ncbi:MAG: glycoside hydrolase family 5 protein [Oscillospiraceae bacterium]|jgi:endoglucanase|nr:glycoside hydrolase family 5 protein [Oscillospiraceae bacterium]
MMKKYLIISILFSFVIFGITACSPSSSDEGDESPDPNDNNGSTIITTPSQTPDPNEVIPPNLAPVPTPDYIAEFNMELSALDVTHLMGAGWNLGNTLDAVVSRTAPKSILTQEVSWGNPITSQEMIQLLADSGFSTLRIPVTWQHFIGPEPDYIIDDQIIDRVQEIVDWAYDLGMFVIINTHHDDWQFPDPENIEAEHMLVALWHQVASRFAGYGERLIFESMNEPRLKGTRYEWTGGTPTARGVINAWNMAFINTVRATGYNNEHRFLMIPTHAASADSVAINDMWVPRRDNRVMVSVHAYTPYDLVLNTRSTRNTFDPDNSNDTNDINQLFDRLNSTFISQGTAVVMGEMGFLNKSGEDGNVPDRVAWTDYYTARAAEVGIPCIWWDNGIRVTTNNEAFALMNRHEVEWFFPEIVEAMVSNFIR